jgi:hypothetical protein
MRYLLGVAALLVLPAALPAQWQQGTPVTSAAHPPRYYRASEEALAAVRSRLRELVDAEEGYFLANQTYTTNLSVLRLPAPEGSGQIFISVTHAGGRAWRATAYHASLPNKSCVVYVGEIDDFALPLTKAERRHLKPGRDGLPACDEP